jgi:hypothetical protein
MPEDKVILELSKRAHDALLALKREDEDVDAFVLRLATAARASGFFGQLRRAPAPPETGR